MRKLFIGFLFIFFIAVANGQMGYDNSKLPRITAPTSSSCVCSLNLSLNTTQGDTFYWRLDGTNNPTANLLTNYNLTAKTFIGGGANLDYILFNTTWTDGHTEGRMHWNSDEGLLELDMAGNEVKQQIGQEIFLPRVTNKQGDTIYNCQMVYISGATGTNPEVKLVNFSNYRQSQAISGMVTQTSIGNNQKGYVTNYGVVRDCDTSSYAAGTSLFGYGIGNYSSTFPSKPNPAVFVGVVLKSHATEGEIWFNPIPVSNLDDIINVNVSTSTGDILVYNATTKLWQGTPISSFGYAKYSFGSNNFVGDGAFRTTGGINASQFCISDDGCLTNMTNLARRGNANTFTDTNSFIDQVDLENVNINGDAIFYAGVDFIDVPHFSNTFGFLVDSGNDIDVKFDFFGNSVPRLTYYGDTGTGGANMIQQSSRGTSTSPSYKQGGDTIGGVNFRAWNGTDWTGNIGRFSFLADGTHSSGNYPTRFSIFTTSSSAGVAPVERFIIDRNGNMTVTALSGTGSMHIVANGSGFVSRAIGNEELTVGNLTDSGLAGTGRRFVVAGGAGKLFPVANTDNLTLNNLTAVGNVNIGGNLVIDGNMSVKRPYGMFSSTQTQTIAVASTAYPITFNVTEDVYLITKSSDNANFSVSQTGDYLIELSAIFETSSANKHAEIWVQKNGVNVARSNTRQEFSSVNTEQVVSVPFIIDLNTTDKFRIMWASDSTTTTLKYTTNTSYSPETPSIIMTMSKISEIT